MPRQATLAAGFDPLQNSPKRHVREGAEGGLALELGARGRGGTETTQEAGQLSRRREGVEAALAEALDQSRLGLAEGAHCECRDVAVPVAGAPAAVAAVGAEFLAEVAGQVARLAAAVQGEFENQLQAFHVALLALDETLRHRLQ